MVICSEVITMLSKWQMVRFDLVVNLSWEGVLPKSLPRLVSYC